MKWNGEPGPRIQCNMRGAERPLNWKPPGVREIGMNNECRLPLNVHCTALIDCKQKKRHHNQCWNWPNTTGGSDVKMFGILHRDWNLKPIFTQKWASVDMNWGVQPPSNPPTNPTLIITLSQMATVIDQIRQCHQANLWQRDHTVYHGNRRIKLWDVDAGWTVTVVWHVVDRWRQINDRLLSVRVEEIQFITWPSQPGRQITNT